MKIRYKKTKTGLTEIAKIYSGTEHGIDKSKVDPDASRIVERLQDEGFETYIVGGAVRDLMLGLAPKDFDIATEASPRQVHKVFHYSRIIGRRFRIVHVVVRDKASGHEKIYEVSTFRSLKDHEDGDDNEFGTIEEDAKRRDFSINSLYYNPVNETVLDFNNAMADFTNRRISSLIPLNRTFIEDPVRMIRAVKAEVSTGFALQSSLKRAIKHYAAGLGGVSSSRLTEELNKILASGHSSEIIRELYKYKLLVYILPCISLHAKEESLYKSLSEHDAAVREQKADGAANKDIKELYEALYSPFIVLPPDEMPFAEKKLDVIRQIKILLSPNTPPNYQVDNSAAKFLADNGIGPVKKKRGSRRKKAPLNSSPKVNSSVSVDADSAGSAEASGIGSEAERKESSRDKSARNRRYYNQRRMRRGGAPVG